MAKVRPGGKQPTPTGPAKRPKKIKKSQHVLTTAKKAETQRLSVTDFRKLIQVAPFVRMIKNYLCDDVQFVSTDAAMVLMECTIEYTHRIMCDSFNITTTCGKRKTLMMNDVHAATRAMGDRLVCGPSTKKKPIVES